jgi:hypothetical protein
MRQLPLCLILLLFCATFPMRANVIDIAASERGSRASDGGGDFSQPLGGYFAGRTTAGLAHDAQWRNYFNFTIPFLSGTLLGATLLLEQPAAPCFDPSCTGGFYPADAGDTFHIFSIYGIGADHDFNSIGAGGAATEYGTVTLDAATNGTMVSISLGGTALADILAAQGGLFHLGGIDSAENFDASDHWIGDWNGTGSYFGQAGHTLLALDIAPEPATWLTMLGVFGLAVPALRHARRGR